jgi:hypothetical protein
VVVGDTELIATWIPLLHAYVPSVPAPEAVSTTAVPEHIEVALAVMAATGLALMVTPALAVATAVHPAFVTVTV